VPPAAASGVPGWLVVALLTVAGLWAVGVTVVTQSGAWLVEQFLMALELEYPPAVWPLVSLGNAFLVALAVLPAALAIRRPRLRAVARCWAVATGCLAALGLARAVPIQRQDYAALALTVAATGLALGIVAAGRRRGEDAVEEARVGEAAAGRPEERGDVVSGVLAGAAVGLLMLIPWWWLGALGSLVDTALTALAALAVGALNGVLLSRVLWPAFTALPMPRWQQILVGGLAAGVALTLLAAGAAPAGTHLLLMAVVPPAGFVLAALATPPRGRWLRSAALVAVAASGPFLFVDPEELTILLGFRDVDLWALVASIASGALALAAGLVALVASVAGEGRKLSLGLRRAVAAGVTVVLVLAGVGVYAAAGQPGFHGERLFVILREQADLSDLASVTNVDERRRQAYQRLVEHADETQRELRSELDDRDLAYTPYYLVNGVEVPDDPLLRAWLDDRPEVDRVLDSPHLRPLPFEAPPERGDTTTAPAGPAWNLDTIGAPQVWDELNVDGRGVVLGESDSGVDGEHPALRENYRGRGGNDDYNWYDPWNGTRAPEDVAGHGTHTTATAVGRQNVGVAPGAEWIGCVNLARNLGNPAYYLDCLQFMLAPFRRGGDPLRDGDPARAADVLNNSWGCPELEGCDPSALLPAARALRAAGIFAVVSAGNAGDRCGSIMDPLALYAEAFTVGASDSRGQVASFSSRGPVTVDGSGREKPDLVAPGVQILSALPDDSYGRLDGTSMAGPHVAGVVALMWQANPKLVGDVDRTADLLRQTTKSGSPVGTDKCGGPENVIGAGVVDALAAVRAATAAP
jgi:subtilisin family serine protease